MDTIFVIVATISLVLNTAWGLYMRLHVIPTWFADMPRSFSLIRTDAPKGWVPLQALFAVAFIGSAITNWSNADVRLYLLITLACYIAIGVSTGVYFIKEILAFAKLPKTTTITPVLQRRVDRWQTLTTGRNILQVAASVCMIVACSYL